MYVPRCQPRAQVREVEIGVLELNFLRPAVWCKSQFGLLPCREKLKATGRGSRAGLCAPPAGKSSSWHDAVLEQTYQALLEKRSRGKSVRGGRQSSTSSIRSTSPAGNCGGGIKNRRARSAVAQRGRCGGTGRCLLVPAGLCSGESVCSPSSRPQKEEAIEKPEFHYDEFGFRVDKEGKARPIPPRLEMGTFPALRPRSVRAELVCTRALRHLEL